MAKPLLRTGTRGGLVTGAVLGAFLGTALLATCGPAPEEGPPEVLVVQQSSVSVGDPHIASDSSNRLAILFSIYEALVELDPAGEVQPALATHWEVEPDGRSWTFHLREGVRFHNGNVLTADDVVASLDRVLDPSIGGAFGTQGVYISYLGTAEISAMDDSTVRIVTEHPMADLLDLLMAMPIGPAEALDRLPEDYVGTGPYRVVSRSPEQMVMAAHEAYWGEAPTYSEIHWIAEADPSARVDALLRGEAHLAADIGVEGWRRISSEGSAAAHQWETGLAIIFMINAMEGPGQDRRVRQALNYALDVDEIIAEIKDGAAEPLNGYLTPHHFGYDPETPPYPYDPEKARALLAEAGYPDGLDLVFDLPTEMPDEAPALARLMAEQYARVGIRLELVEHQDRAAYSEMVREKRIQDAACFDSSPRSTYRVLREKLHSGLKGPWWEGYHNERVNALIQEAEATIPDPERQAIYREIYSLVTEDAPWIFLYRPLRYYGAGPRLQHWEPRADGLLIFN